MDADRAAGVHDEKTTVQEGSVLVGEGLDVEMQGGDRFFVGGP